MRINTVLSQLPLAVGVLILGCTFGLAQAPTPAPAKKATPAPQATGKPLAAAKAELFDLN
jgi:hypothetical protein